jgi:hypothetical protein
VPLGRIEILYHLARVHLATRNQAEAQAIIEEIEALNPAARRALALRRLQRARKQSLF